GQREARQRDAEPRGGAQRAIAGCEKEQARRVGEGNEPDIPRYRQQSMLAEQRDDLVDGADESDEIDDRERPLEQEARVPVTRQVGRRHPTSLRDHEGNEHAERTEPTEKISTRFSLCAPGVLCETTWRQYNRFMRAADAVVIGAGPN